MHEIVKCVCGRVLMQCRCWSPDKAVRVVKPCRCEPELTAQELGAALRKLGPGGY